MSRVESPILSRPEWVERRRGGIGGSDVAAILGMSRYKTPLDIYLQKRGLVESDDEGPRLEMGRFMEKPLIEWYVEQNNCHPTLFDTFVRHPQHDFLIANLDAPPMRGENEDVWLVDSKNVHYKSLADWGEEGSDEVPMDALFQAHHYLFLVPEAFRLDFIVLRGGHWPPRVYPVRSDNEFYRELVLPKMIRFWFEHVVAGIPPTPDFSDDKSLESIRAMFPPTEEKGSPAIVLPPSTVVGERSVAIDELAEAYDALGRMQKEAETRKRRVEAALRAVLGDERAGLAGDVEIKRIYNKGGYRPAHDVKPYDYLKINFPKNYEKKLTAERITALLPGEING